MSKLNVETIENLAASSSVSVSDIASKNAFSANTGSSLVGFKQNGTGSVNRTVDSKLKEFVSVKDFGAVGDGVTDDTVAFSNAFNIGTCVYVPSGTYLLNFLSVPSNAYLFGDGTNTIIKPLTPDTRCAIGAESANATTYIENITICDVKFLGEVATMGFSEHKHLCSFNGVKNMLIENCHFIGFRGDGIYLGSGDAGGTTERHNINVKIKNCFFDGVNNDNRNGVSVIDVNGLSITECQFWRCTRANMPGAIDVEPNANTFHVIKNIDISNNYFDTVRRGVLITNMDNITEMPFGITLENNSVNSASDAGLSVMFSFNTSPLTASSKSMAIRVVGNSVKNGGIPINVSGVKDIEISQNHFVDCTASCVLGNGVFARLASYDVTFSENTIERCGTAGTTWFSGAKIDGITNLLMRNNTFTDCGDNIINSGCGVLFAPSYPSAVSNVLFVGNIFNKPAYTNMHATRLITSTISYSYDHVYGNNFNGLTSIFLADSGTWVPSVSFTTPGDLSVSYAATRTGIWRRDGKRMLATYDLTTTTFTHTTASGNLTLNGLPVNNSATAEYNPIATYQGITKAGFTSFAMQVRPSTNVAWGWASGSGQTSGTISTTNVPSGGTVILTGCLGYTI